MINIVEKIMEREYREINTVYSLEEAEALDLDIVFEAEEIDEDYGTVVYECCNEINTQNVVDIMRDWLSERGHEVEDLTSEELSEYVDKYYNDLYFQA